MSFLNQHPVSLFACTVVMLTSTAMGGVCSNIPIVSNDLAAFDGFGHAVAVSHNKKYFIVGVPGDDNQYGLNAGAAYIYQNIGGEWTQMLKAMPSNLQFGDNYGASVDIDDDYAVMGAPFADVTGLNSGRVTVYRRGSLFWVADQHLAPADGGQSHWFGQSVAIGGNFVAVGAPYHDLGGNDSIGRVYLYKRINNTWTLDGMRDFNQASPAGAQFGHAVAVAKGDNGEDRFAAGAPGAVVNGQVNRGRILVQNRYNGSSWSAQQWITPGDGHAGARFGESIAFGGQYLYVAAPGATVNSVPNAGAVYVYRVVMQDGVASYVQAGKIAEWPTPNRKFGMKISASGTDLVVTDATGWVYRFHVTQGAMPTQIKTHLLGRWEKPSGVSEKFGQGGAVWTGEELLVGDPGFDAPGMTDAGRVHSFSMGINPGSNVCELAPVINLSNIDDLRINCTVGSTVTSASTCVPVGGPDMFYRVELPAGKYRFTFTSAHSGCDMSVHQNACPDQPNSHNNIGCVHLVGGNTTAQLDLQLTDQSYILRMATYNNVNAGPLRVDITPLTCDSDLTGDANVDVSDLLALLSAWGQCQDCDADLNGDGWVDVSDLLVMLSSWGVCP